MKFIWISGSINSGKSTVATALNKKIKKSVNIECDTLRHFATYENLDNVIDFILEDSIDLAKKWSERGYLPIITWPIYGTGLDKLISYSKELGIEPVIINLTPEKEIAKQNRGLRELTEKEFNRIEYMYETENIGNPLMGYSIDNTNQTVEETMDEVMNYISEIVKSYL